MKALIFANDKQRKESIKQLCYDKFGNDVHVSDYNFQNINNAILIIDNNDVYDFAGIEFDQKNNIYLFENNNLYPILQEKELLSLREQYTKEKNWKLVKLINQVIINTDFLLKRSIQNGLPDSFQIETTNKCNAECIMCFHFYKKNNNASHLSNKVVNKLKDILPYTDRILLHGMGEPFLNPKIVFQINEYVKYGIRMTTNTNLSVINEELLFLIDNHFDWIEISCDGATKKTYELIRKNLSFENFIINLQLLKEKCPKVRKHFATVIMRQNIFELPEMVKLAHKFGINMVAFMSLSTNPVIDNINDCMLNYPNVLYHYINMAKYEGEKCGVEVVSPFYDIRFTKNVFEKELEIMNKMSEQKTDEEIQKIILIGKKLEQYSFDFSFSDSDVVASEVKCFGICDWVLKGAFIDLHGEVAICCINQNIKLGKLVGNGSFKDIWNNSSYRKIREIFYSGFLPDCCLGCSIIERGLVKYLRLEITSKFYQESEITKNRKKKLNEILNENL